LLHRLSPPALRSIEVDQTITSCTVQRMTDGDQSATPNKIAVTGSVSRKTAVLVADSVEPDTTKAVAARQYDTRVVTPNVFAEMVEFVQPAATEPQPASSKPDIERAGHNSVPGTPPASGTRPPAEDPATIRAWARQRGMTVGIRGRLPADVLAAYRAAHHADSDNG